MGSWFDQFVLIVVNASLSAVALLAVLALGVVVCCQPARRLLLVQGTFLGLLALLPLEATGLLPRIELWSFPEWTGLAGLDATRNWVAETEHELGYAVQGWPWWVRILVAGYAVGVAGSLGWLALGYLALSRLVRRSLEPSPETLELYLGLETGRPGPRPYLLVSDRLRSPLLVGLLHPKILIPAEFDDPDPTPERRARLRLSLLHELAHHATFDPWYLLVGRLAQAFWFFLPPVGWVVERMRLDQELIADRRAALGFGPVGDYAASLLDLAAATASRTRGAERQELLSEVVSELDGRRLPVDPLGSPLVQRLRMLVRSPYPIEPSAPSGWSRGLQLLTVVATLGAASLAMVPASAARGPLASRSGNSDHLFFLSELEVAESEAQPNGRAPRVELPIPLPETYDLTVDIYATSDALHRTRIVGQAIGKPADAQSSAGPAEATWHKVRLRQLRNGIVLIIDGRAQSLPEDRDPLPLWLTLEVPPGHEGHYRNLRLLW